MAKYKLSLIRLRVKKKKDGFQIRRTTVENGVPCLTSLDTANALTNVIESMTFSMRTM